MSAASGQYIHFCDADDWIEPETYSDIVPKLVEEDADVALLAGMWILRTKVSFLQSAGRIMPWTVSGISMIFFMECLLYAAMPAV